MSLENKYLLIIYLFTYLPGSAKRWYLVELWPSTEASLYFTSQPDAIDHALPPFGDSQRHREGNTLWPPWILRHEVDEALLELSVTTEIPTRPTPSPGPPHSGMNERRL